MANGWSGIGYHFVVLNGILTGEDYQQGRRRFKSMTGMIECGRPLDGDMWVDSNEVGAHVLNFNSDSIGICVIHSLMPYKYQQLNGLLHLCADLCTKFGIAAENVVGHCELDPVNKPDCPGLDMQAFRLLLQEEL